MKTVCLYLKPEQLSDIMTYIGIPNCDLSNGQCNLLNALNSAEAENISQLKNMGLLSRFQEIAGDQLIEVDLRRLP